MLFRDSSLVAVEHVTITGANGPDAPAIRSALRSAARNVTTLDVQVSQLRSSLSSFPEVKGLRVSAQFPHRLTIHVIERLPVAVIQLGPRQVAVAGDGTILHGIPVTSPLPVLPASVPPVGRRLTEPSLAGDLDVLAAAPYRLLSRVSQVTSGTGHGLVAQIRGGPSIYFGAPTDLASKWIAASEVLGDASSNGAAYIDVSDAEHPAAGESTGSSSSDATSAPTGAGTGG